LKKDELLKEIDREISFYKKHIKRSKEVLSNLKTTERESKYEQARRLSLVDFRREHIDYSERKLEELKDERDNLLGKSRHKEETKIMDISDLVGKVVEKTEEFVWDKTMFFRNVAEGIVDELTGKLYKFKKPKKTRNASSYVLLGILISVFFIFIGKGSITGYSVLETVTNSNLVSFVLVFILGLLVFLHLKSD